MQNNNKCFEECLRHCQGMFRKGDYVVLTFIGNSWTAVSEIWHKGVFVCEGYTFDDVDYLDVCLETTIRDLDNFTKTTK